MIQTVKQACKFNPVISDYRMSQGVENLSDLISDEGDGREFFSRNFVTKGMEQLFKEGMLRLSGKSDQAVFELTQAMGGGKTHMMIALGLLAKHPHLRPEILPEKLNSRLDFSNARIAAFNGRNNPDNYIWGDIATQLGAAEAIREHWVNGPKAVDQKKWMEIIGDTPTLIMIDELPPYLDNASTQTIGAGTLANIVVYSLSNLMAAALELPNCCIVIANLAGSYGKTTKALSDAVSNLQQETRRQSMTITPVQLSGNEIYDILKKRLIDVMPSDSVINEIAEEYAQQIKKAEAGGYIIASSIEQISEQIRETYPFHPSFKHLVALFKENEGFRQTRGLMQFTARLLKSVDERETDDVYLIGTQHLNLNDDQVKDEIERISPKLIPAVTRDIADKGNAIAETLDAELDTDAAQQVMTLLLASSLSRAVGGRIGLSQSEIIEFLAAPNRKPDEFLTVIDKLRDQAWYLHREDQRYFIKETENLSRQIERNAKDIPQPKIDSALSNRLSGILQPNSKVVYQDVKVLPRMSELNLRGSRVLIVIKPDGRVPSEELNNFFEFQQEKNNLLVLTGQDSMMADGVEDRLRELYAIEQISKNLKSGDTLYEEARDRLEEAESRFNKALSGAYNTILFPGVDEMDGSERFLKVTIDNGLRIGTGDQSAEKQIEELMASPRANYKLAADLKDEFPTYFSMAEYELWPSGENNRRTPWKDVVSKAKCNPGWPWMPGSSGMDTLKNEALKQGVWRLGEDGYIEKGPFPKEKTSVNITAVSSNPDTGETLLNLTARNAGDSPVIHYSTSPGVSTSDPTVDDPENFVTEKATLYFLVVDSSGKYETGNAERWIADLTIRHQIESLTDKRKVTLKCTPDAEMFYTLDGTNPKEGIKYELPFEISSEEALLLVYAQSGEASQDRKFNIPRNGDTTVQIDDNKPAHLEAGKTVTIDTTNKVFEVINEFKGKETTTFKGVRIELGEAENTISLRFGGRKLTAQMIEQAVNSIREVIGEADTPVSVTIREGIDFDNGYEAKQFAELVGIKLSPSDITQDH